MNPLVSVLIFAYNHEDYIEMAINSVISQKCSFDIEIIVSDDFSTDNTLSIINQKQKEFPHLIEIISNQKNIGLNKTFENAVQYSKGEFIALLGGDDYWIISNKLELQVESLMRNKSISFVHTEYKSIKTCNGKIKNGCNRSWRSKLMHYQKPEIALSLMLRHAWTGYPLASSSCFRKKPLLDGLTAYPEILNFNYSGEGTILHMSICLFGGAYDFIPTESTMYRIREESLCHYKNMLEQFDFEIRYFKLRNFAAHLCTLDKKHFKAILVYGFWELMCSSLKYKAFDSFTYLCKHDEYIVGLKGWPSIVLSFYQTKIGKKILLFFVPIRKVYKKFFSLSY